MKIVFTLCFTVLLLKVSAQNTFPSTGPAGIGVTTNLSKPFTIQQQTNGDGIMLWSPAGGANSGRYLQMATNPTYPWIYNIWSNSRLDISAGQQMFLMADEISFSGNVILTRTGDPSSLLTSKSSRAMPFQSNLWDGEKGVMTYAGLLNVASTTKNLAHRLAFKTSAINTDLSDGLEVLSVLSDTSVGINTTNTYGYRLAVNGSAIFTKAVVRSYNTWADYVFDKSYRLPSLAEVEDYIKLNQHLPEVPTTAQVEKEGIDLGSNQTLLLKKVEELTLYLIDQNKRLEQQEQEILLLKQQLQPKPGN